MRKVSEPTCPKSPKIIVTFHDTDSQAEILNPFAGALSAEMAEEKGQKLHESYRVRRPSNTESESGYSNHSSPGSPGVSQHQSFIYQELEEKLSEFRLNNPSEFETLEQLFPENTFNTTENTHNSSDSMLYNDIDQLLSENVPSYETLRGGDACDQEVEYDGDEILKRLAS